MIYQQHDTDENKKRKIYISDPILLQNLIESNDSSVTGLKTAKAELDKPLKQKNQQKRRQKKWTEHGLNGEQLLAHINNSSAKAKVNAELLAINNSSALLVLNSMGHMDVKRNTQFRALMSEIDKQNQSKFKPEPPYSHSRADQLVSKLVKPFSTPESGDRVTSFL